jgi:hypothetical protein
MRLVRKRIAAIAAGILLLGTVPARGDPIADAIDAARKSVGGCAGCYWFAIPASDPIVRKQTLFRVSTLDRIPSPVLTIAIPKSGDPLLLDAKRLFGWNRMIAEEKPPLQTKADWEIYVRSFAGLTTGGGSFVPQLLPDELARVKKRARGATKDSLQVVRGKELVSVSFFMRTAAGALQLWDLLLEQDGTITKSNVYDF